MGLGEDEAELPTRLRHGRPRLVGGNDANLAIGLHARVPCLVAMGPDADPVARITDEGLAALAAHEGRRAPPPRGRPAGAP